MLVGQRVGPFDVEKQLGSGAMGTVYRARYRKTGQRVALKIMAPGLGGNATALARFEREAEVLKRLSHPNIVRFYAASQFQGTPYYAMEYIEGESLDHVLHRRGRLTWEEVVELGRQICSALQHAHSQGVIHRDLKPSNLMLTADGTLKLTDFGIAKDLDVTQLTSANCTVGTASYMSPEQCRGEPHLTHKSDLYSLGVMLYELLTGERPFRAETPMDMFLQHVNALPERPSRKVLDIPVWLDTLVCQLLEKKPEHRPFDAVVVAQALDQVAEKVAAQQSAGIDVVRGRKTLRAGEGGSEQETSEHKVVRTLLQGRRKRRRKPLYEKGWFQAVGLSLLLLAIAGFLFMVFRAPPADELFAQAQRLMESGNPEDHTLARNGPIKEYLTHYAERQDAQAKQMHAWADRYDMALCAQQLDNRQRLNLAPEGEAETQARRALTSEQAGNWSAVEEQWRDVAKHQNDADPEVRTWGLLAEKRLQELATAAVLEHMLPLLLRSQSLNLDVLQRETAAVRAGQEFRPKQELVMQASKALRYEQFGDVPAARTNWQGLKEKCARDLEQRPWFLLAAKHVQDLKAAPSPENKEEETKQRLQRIGEALQEARHLAEAKQPRDRQQARLLCQEILDLYKHYPNFRDSAEPGLSTLVDQVQQLADQLAPPPEPKR